MYEPVNSSKQNEPKSRNILRGFQTGFKGGHTARPLKTRNRLWATIRTTNNNRRPMKQVRNQDVSTETQPNATTPPLISGLEGVQAAREKSPKKRSTELRLDGLKKRRTPNSETKPTTLVAAANE